MQRVTAELAAAARVNEDVGKRLLRRGIRLGRHDHVYALPVATQRGQRVVERAFATARNVPVAAEHEKIRRTLLRHRIHRQLVDLDLIALQDCISCHSERSEESRNPRTLDSSSLRSSE